MKFREPLKITSRTSSIKNSFVQAIIPSIEPTKEEIEEALGILGMTFDDRRCAYCGTKSTDWDHLRPLVRGRRPTGYIHEIRNLVPSCGPCNQSKSGRDWRSWIESASLGSPKTKNVPDLAERISRLEQFEKWGAVKPLPLDELAGRAQWDDHWANLEAIIDKMKVAQKHAMIVRDQITAALNQGRQLAPISERADVTNGE